MRGWSRQHSAWGLVIVQGNAWCHIVSQFQDKIMETVVVVFIRDAYAWSLLWLERVLRLGHGHTLACAYPPAR
jgi:hypothetical protein